MHIHVCIYAYIYRNVTRMIVLCHSNDWGNTLDRNHAKKYKHTHTHKQTCTFIKTHAHILRGYLDLWCERCLLITESPKTPGHFRYLIWVLYTHTHTHTKAHVHDPTVPALDHLPLADDSGKLHGLAAVITCDRCKSDHGRSFPHFMSVNLLYKKCSCLLFESITSFLCVLKYF